MTVPPGEAEIPDQTAEAEILTEGIAAAIKAHDFAMVASQLRTLAVIDPRQAQAVWDAIQAGITIRKGTP